jgi:hypothetical protein
MLLALPDALAAEHGYNTAALFPFELRQVAASGLPFLHVSHGGWLPQLWPEQRRGIPFAERDPHQCRRLRMCCSVWPARERRLLLLCLPSVASRSRAIPDLGVGHHFGRAAGPSALPLPASLACNSSTLTAGHRCSLRQSRNSAVRPVEWSYRRFRAAFCQRSAGEREAADNPC